MIRRIVIASALATLSTAAAAQHQGYVSSGYGNVVRSGYGECVRSGYWTPADAFEPCDYVARAAVAPAPVAVAEPAPEPEAAPAPVAQPEAPRRVIERLTLSADVLFEFNKAELTEAGKRTLDQLAAQVSGAEVEEISVVGHADRIASAAYNQGLSLERARSVTRYLVEIGAPISLIAAQGKGESEPVTDCHHMGPERASNRKLVACLQPDRRVDIEVLGSREVSAEHAAAGGASSR